MNASLHLNKICILFKTNLKLILVGNIQHTGAGKFPGDPEEGRGGAYRPTPI